MMKKKKSDDVQLADINVFVAFHNAVFTANVMNFTRLCVLHDPEKTFGSFAMIAPGSAKTAWKKVSAQSFLDNRVENFGEKIPELKDMQAIAIILSAQHKKTQSTPS
ncbi:hypothetical protein MKK67_00445 [Methylobacterium sp. J-072]|uniref:hypothetical protein n=1 Tax=Methylobacterium sp. J-072 TaxID=2836651 RepID=UPI001FBA9E4B|nr:hypothetical protein [Methylobacterium sp. J-072]MCJ2090984.1 hypothetical protein [Methylobacterium sp. J-072]